MIKVKGKNYTAEYIQRAVAALEAAGVKDTGKDNEDVYLAAMTEKGEIRVLIAPNEYHSVTVDIASNIAQCRAMNVMDVVLGSDDTISLPLATIEVPDSSTTSYCEVKEGKPAGCPRIFLYNKLEDDCSHIVFLDGNDMKIVEN